MVMLSASMFSVQASNTDVQATDEDQSDDGIAKWKFIIYLVADNSLDVSTVMYHEQVVEDDFNELMSVGSTDEVVCYVFVDRFEGPANLFKMNAGWMEEITDFPLNAVEANMGDPATLTNLIEYTYTVAPSEHTVLMFWDHGSPNYICLDDNGPEPGAPDELTHHEAIAALQGYKVDIVGADECLVGQIEVMYEYATSGADIEYMLASETYTGWRGYPYDQIFREMVENPDMTTRECAVMFIEQVDILLNATPYMSECVNCHAAIELAKVKPLVAGFQSMASAIYADMANYTQILARARGTSEFQYGAGAIGLIDFRNFVEALKQLSPSNDIKEACTDVLADFDATIVALQDSMTVEGYVNGLGLRFPQFEFEYPEYYPSYAFASEGWIDFMNLFWTLRGTGGSAA